MCNCCSNFPHIPCQYTKVKIRLGYNNRVKRKALLPFLCLVIAATGFYIYNQVRSEPAVAPAAKVTADQPPAAEKQQPSLPFVDVQPVIDAWAAKQRGSAGVVVYDLANKKTSAVLNPDKTFFTASIYKLFVAYEGYQKIADGTYALSDDYLFDYNRGRCLDEMIRSSYSPCGEKMWNELGKSTLSAKLKTYGVKNTDMTGLQTSAADAAIVLQRLYDRLDLTDEHTNLYLDSLKSQPAKYRTGLPAGFPDATVYNKVGWNEDLEWHDTAIVSLPNGRSYVICLLTRGVGSRHVVELAKSLNAELSK